jgi:hypothetical protein
VGGSRECWAKAKAMAAGPLWRRGSLWRRDQNKLGEGWLGSLGKSKVSAHACNPSYSAGRDQEAHDSKPAWANSFRDPALKKPITKKGWWSGSRYRL